MSDPRCHVNDAGRGVDGGLEAESGESEGAQLGVQRRRQSGAEEQVEGEVEEEGVEDGRHDDDTVGAHSLQ